MRETVVLVHGIWMRGGSLFLLQSRLRECGFDCRAFTYRSVRRSAANNADRLQAFLAGIDADIVHLVGHSLGGIVILHLFERHPRQPPGRVVFLGSPVRGSAVARRGAQHAVSRLVLGESLRGALCGGTPPWRATRPLGIVAGTRSIGIGRVLGGLRGPNDGTVAVCETRVAEAADSVELPVSHSGMVASRRVAAQVCAFLKSGRFDA